ncbi:hypothetical protein HELRODRAFT_129502, partial [Helobdella robusta]|uniref:Uncharacterized protein n=1 Tax=Helobdella robusta TaxID=6412 RepID=T1EHR6_HELRO
FFECVGALCSIFVLVLFTTFCKWLKDVIFSDIRANLQNDPFVPVLANGILVDVPASELVVGDIVNIVHGETVPADGVLIESVNMLVDESFVPDESNLKIKDETDDNIMLSGTGILNGKGKMVVTVVGQHTKIAEYKRDNSQDFVRFCMPTQTLSSFFIILTYFYRMTINICNGIHAAHKQTRSAIDAEQTIIRNQLIKFNTAISGLGLVLATTLICSIKFTYSYLKDQLKWSREMNEVYIGFLLFGLTMIVVSIPEGAAMISILSSAFTVERMMKDQILLRNMTACENLANVTTIITEKTGILSTDRMTVVECFIGGKMTMMMMMMTHSHKYAFNTFQTQMELLEDSISINCNYASELMTSKRHESEPPIQIGNKIECALLSFLGTLKINYQVIRTRVPVENIIKVFPFKPGKNTMTTIYSPYTERFLVLTKGAAIKLLPKCRYKINSVDAVVELDEEERNHIEKIIHGMHNYALKTLMLAFRDISLKDEEVRDMFDDHDFNDEETIESNLILLAVFGIEDPLRPDSAEYVSLCQRAGIKVRITTTDKMKSAQSMAYKCGILKSKEQTMALTSTQFNKLIRRARDNILFDSIWPQLVVLSNCTPQDKFNLVSGIMKSDMNAKEKQVVLVTGSGTNDGTSLVEADIGVAMGLTGTDVAIRASDLTVLDDSFSTVVRSVMWWRNVYKGVSNFLQFQLTVNLVVMSFCFICACLIKYVPLKPMQMMFINLIIDPFASFAFGTQYPTKHLCKKPPSAYSDFIVTKEAMRNIGGHAAYQLIVLFSLLYAGHTALEIDNAMSYPREVDSRQNTIIYNSLIMMTLFNQINCRKISDDCNMFRGVSIVITTTTQVLLIEFEVEIFHVVKLTVDEWLWCVSFGVGELLW